MYMNTCTISVSVDLTISLTFKALTFFLYKPWKPKGFIQFEIIINVLVIQSDSFEYLCYGSTIIINIFTFTVRGSTLVVRI